MPLKNCLVFLLCFSWPNLYQLTIYTQAEEKINAYNNEEYLLMVKYHQASSFLRAEQRRGDCQECKAGGITAPYTRNYFQKWYKSLPRARTDQWCEGG